jgi:hypothetical protein
MSVELKNEARREWRELGFFFNYDAAARKWIVVGPPSGIRKFRAMLVAYGTEPSPGALSEHEHYGPYQDLKLVTWSAAEIRKDGIYGRPSDFVRLADEVDRALESGATSVVVGAGFTGSAATDSGRNELEIQVAPDDFDPASADSALTA